MHHRDFIFFAFWEKNAPQYTILALRLVHDLADDFLKFSAKGEKKKKEGEKKKKEREKKEKRRRKEKSQ